MDQGCRAYHEVAMAIGFPAFHFPNFSSNNGSNEPKSWVGELKKINPPWSAIIAGYSAFVANSMTGRPLAYMPWGMAAKQAAGGAGPIAILGSIPIIWEAEKAVEDGRLSLAEGVAEAAIDTGIGISSGIAGMVLGAKTGAAAGTVVPGAGNVVGVIAGGFIGFGLAMGLNYIKGNFVPWAQRDK